jgi:CheY-like chemotaxis protein
VRILILDDDLERHEVFARNFEGYDVVHCQTYDSCLQALVNQGPFDVVFLDHDLNDHARSVGPMVSMYGGYGGLREYDGRDVARFIAKQLQPALLPKQIVVHSWNDTEGDEMMKILAPLGLPLRREEFHPNIRV